MENVLKCDVALSSSMLSRTDLKLKDIGFHAMGGWQAKEASTRALLYKACAEPLVSWSGLIRAQPNPEANTGATEHAKRHPSKTCAET